MKKVAVLVLMFASLMISAVVAPVFAVGPWQAEEVGNNPKFGVNLLAGRVFLDTPSGDRIGWGDEVRSHYVNALHAEGIMNTAIDADINTFRAILANPAYFENKWIYLSGENSGNWYNPTPDNPSMRHGIFYWLLRSKQVGFTHAEAMATVADAPDGMYMMMNTLGS